MTTMERFRFSLLGLFGFLTLVALGFAALSQANRAWQVATTATMVVVLAGSALLATLGAGATKAFCTGFVVVAWTYIFCSVLFGTGDDLMPTNLALNWYLDARYGENVQSAARAAADHIGALLTIAALGLIGGLAGRQLYFRRERERLDRELAKSSGSSREPDGR
jgi:hypothetical protein